jgi:hypothetical protein
LHLHKNYLYPLCHVLRKAVTEIPDEFDHAIDAPGLLELNRLHSDVTGAEVFKAAIALVNVHQTGHTHTFFNNWESGRIKFPFIPASLEALSPETFEATDVSGPMMQCVCNVYRNTSLGVLPLTT